MYDDKKRKIKNLNNEKERKVSKFPNWRTRLAAAADHHLHMEEDNGEFSAVASVKKQCVNC